VLTVTRYVYPVVTGDVVQVTDLDNQSPYLVTQVCHYVVLSSCLTACPGHVHVMRETLRNPFPRVFAGETVKQDHYLIDVIMHDRSPYAGYQGATEH